MQARHLPGARARHHNLLSEPLHVPCRPQQIARHGLVRLDGRDVPRRPRADLRFQYKQLNEQRPRRARLGLCPRLLECRRRRRQVREECVVDGREVFVSGPDGYLSGSIESDRRTACELDDGDVWKRDSRARLAWGFDEGIRGELLSRHRACASCDEDIDARGVVAVDAHPRFPPAGNVVVAVLVGGGPHPPSVHGVKHVRPAEPHGSVVTCDLAAVHVRPLLEHLPPDEASVVRLDHGHDAIVRRHGERRGRGGAGRITQRHTSVHAHVLDVPVELPILLWVESEGVGLLDEGACERRPERETEGRTRRSRCGSDASERGLTR